MSTLLILCAFYGLGGLIFATLMFLASGRLQKLYAQSGSDALTIQIGSTKVSTSNVIIGLGVVALIAMIGVPAYFLYVTSKINDAPVDVLVGFSPTGKTVVVQHDDGGGSFQSPMLRIYKSRDQQAFLLEDARNKSLVINVLAWYDPVNGPMARVNGKSEPIQFNGESGFLGPLTFQTESEQPQTRGPSSLTRSVSPVPASLHQIDDPLPVSQSAGAINSAGLQSAAASK